jgi:hypothetical protein
MTQTQTAPPTGALGLRVGELVEVRSAAEILATLDTRGELENLPFMPEMLQFCGQRLTVHKVAHKLCDTISRSGLRKMEHAVHLTAARCGGEFHGGCQTACSMYWKEAWLRRVEPGDPAPAAGGLAEGRRALPILEINTRKDPGPDGGERFSCQATELLRAAPVGLPFKDFSQYVLDVKTGNVGVLAMLGAFFVAAFNRFQSVTEKVLPPKLRFRGGLRWGFVKGGAVGKTPTAKLDLQPGELVRIRSKEEIFKTLNEDLLNRGMGFEEEMARYCGQTAVVRARVDKCLDEKTGEMLTMKSPCIILEDIVCEGVYNRSCPREFVPFWREIWLERVDQTS